jgi:hypothetical protein
MTSWPTFGNLSEHYNFFGCTFCWLPEGSCFLNSVNKTVVLIIFHAHPAASSWDIIKIVIARFEVLWVVLLKVQVLWLVSLCCWASSYQCFVGTTILQNVGSHSQNDTVSHPRRLAHPQYPYYINVVIKLKKAKNWIFQPSSLLTTT